MALFPRATLWTLVSLLCLIACPPPALAAEEQHATAGTPPVSLARIRAAVENPKGRSLKLDVPLQLPVATFKTSVDQRAYMLSFEERLAKEFKLNHLQRQSQEWGSRCCGLDIGALLAPIDRALQERKQRKIRQQIARELEELKAAAGK